MLLSTILLGVTALVSGIRAQSTETPTTTSSSTSTSTSTSSSGPAIHSIAVGAEGYKFSPDTVNNASVGDIIEFRFYPTGHSVVRSEFKIPCIPYEDTGPNKVGFFSGFMDVATITNNGPTFSVRVNDTQPIFFYCAAPGSCIDNYMIGVINPNKTETYDIQLEYTKNATTQLTPGEALPSETAAATSTATSSKPTSGSSSGGGHSGSALSGGAIAGIAIGGAVVLLLAATLLYLCGRRGGLEKAYYRQRAGRSSNPPMLEATYNGGPPKSPGQETFATTAYSTTPSNDPYQQQQQHASGQGIPHGVPGYPVSSGSPPPMSVHSQNSYQHFGNAPGMGSPLIQGMDNGTVQAGYYNVSQTGTPPPHQQQQNLNTPPVELPTSKDPGNSPLPGYSHGGRTFSWLTGGEGSYRPGKPSS
ncbi:hypothetical protein VM1G_02092 [Cytospora mali]|uniref:Extracellular serine-rich protein n=1 Tax=Cytospora mali TaxID=578113 RepID=A0A194VQW6_CYTMA|nr:hypothetical protein VM1G_02092 [Valsa mali]